MTTQREEAFTQFMEEALDRLDRVGRRLTLLLPPEERDDRRLVPGPRDEPPRTQGAT
jgi:hypothetical protein